MLDRFTGYKRLLALAALNGGGASIIERTAIGNPLTFVTDLARPLRSLLIPFTPQQEGTGDPSPSNIRSIIPWNGLTVWNGGVNTFDGELEKGSLDNSGNNSPSSANVRCKNYIPVVPGAAYYVKYKVTSPGASNMKLYYYGADKTYINSFWKAPNTSTIPDNVYFVRFYMDTAYTSGTDRDIGINYPSTETGYEAPNITETDIVFPSPVYGGTLDVVSGVLTVEWVLMSKKWSEWEFGEALTNVTRKTLTLPQQQEMYVQRNEGNSKTNVTDVYLNSNSSDTVHYYINQRGNVLYAFLPNDLDGETVVQFSAKLITPYEVQLTGEQITALIGNNTIWSDADGQMTAVYLLTESFGDEHPISGGLGSGLLGGGFGSGSGEPDEPVDPDEPGEPDQPDEPAEPDQPGEE